MVYESISPFFVVLRGNLFELLQGDSSAYESPMNSGIMNGDKPIGLQEVKQLIEKPVRTLLNQLDKIVYVAQVQATWMALS